MQGPEPTAPGAVPAVHNGECRLGPAQNLYNRVHFFLPEPWNGFRGGTHKARKKRTLLWRLGAVPRGPHATLPSVDGRYCGTGCRGLRALDGWGGLRGAPGRWEGWQGADLPRAAAAQTGGSVCPCPHGGDGSPEVPRRCAAGPWSDPWKKTSASRKLWITGSSAKEGGGLSAWSSPAWGGRLRAFQREGAGTFSEALLPVEDRSLNPRNSCVPGTTGGGGAAVGQESPVLFSRHHVAGDAAEMWPVLSLTSLSQVKGLVVARPL